MGEAHLSRAHVEWVLNEDAGRDGLVEGSVASLAVVAAVVADGARRGGRASLLGEDGGWCDALVLVPPLAGVILEVELSSFAHGASFVAVLERDCGELDGIG